MKVIITGATGMVGEGVLLECLADPQVTEVLSVSRKSTGINHTKVKEYIVKDFLTLKENDEMLRGYDACFYCAGISSVGMKEEEYRRITYDTTINFAKAMSPNAQKTFIYVSGGGTDSTEKGKLRWARIKGKTENDLMKLPFKQAFAFRPGFMEPTNGQRNVLKLYKYVGWIAPVIRIILPNIITTMQQVGQAMIYATKAGYEKNVVEVKDIKVLGNRSITVKN